MVSNDEVIRTEIARAAEDLGEPEIECTVRNGFVTLTGSVSSEETASRLERLTRGVQGVTGVDNRLEPREYGAMVSPDADIEEIDLSAGFDDDVGTTDPLGAVSEAEPYFPPTDPVVRPEDDSDRLEIEGGFGQNAGQPTRIVLTGDEELTTAVEDALRLDAATAQLDISVEVRDGVARLRGIVQSLEDIEMAESVAGAVPGIEEVREELSIEGM